MESLKRSMFMRKMDRGDFYIPPEAEYPINHGDKVWIGEEEPTDPTIKFWIVGTDNMVRVVHADKNPPQDTSKLWLEV